MHSGYCLAELVNSFSIEFLQSAVLGTEEASDRAVKQGLWAWISFLCGQTRCLILKTWKGASWAVQSRGSKNRRLPLAACTHSNPCLFLKSTNFGIIRLVFILTSQGEHCFGIQGLSMEWEIMVVIGIFVHAMRGDPEMSPAEIVAMRMLCVNCRQWTNVSDYCRSRTLLQCCEHQMQRSFGFLAGEDLVKGPSSFVDLASAQRGFISKVLAPGHLIVLESVTMTVVVILIQSLSSVQLFKRGLHKFMSIELGMPSNHLILCHPLLLLLSIFPSIRSFPVSQLFTSGGQSSGASASGPLLDCH